MTDESRTQEKPEQDIESHNCKNAGDEIDIAVCEQKALNRKRKSKRD